MDSEFDAGVSRARALLARPARKTEVMWDYSGTAKIRADNMPELRRVVVYLEKKSRVKIKITKRFIVQTWLGFGPDELHLRLEWSTDNVKLGQAMGDYLQAAIRHPGFRYGLFP